MAEHAIRIPPRRLVVYTDRISKLLACNEMTRLGNTRQLGFTHLVYPGAQGTRLEHSLGVYELACHFVARMSSHPIFRRICGDSRDCLLFVLAALLHDAGHFPFAHQLEEFRKDNFSADQWRNIHKLLDGGHEKRTCEIIKDNLSALLKEHFNLSEGEIDRLLLLIKKVRNGSEDAKTLDADPGLRFLKSIINHPVDIDKLDYIERDAYHCGVPYGNYIDVDRIFETMRLIPDNNNGAYLAFDQRGVGCIESLVTARHQLYANVYWHRAVRSATAMFKHLFFLFQAEVNDEDVIEKIFLESGSDLACLRLLEEHAENNMVDSVAKKAILHFARVVSGRERALYKAVVQREHTDQYQIEYGTIQYQNQRLKALDIYNTIKEEKLWNTQAEDLGEHNILIDCRADNWPDFESIRTITPLGKEEPLSTVAATVRELKTSFVKQACRIRVFINTNSLKPQYQDKIGRRKVEEVIAAKMEGAGMGT